jgi:hypothetical protein
MTMSCGCVAIARIDGIRSPAHDSDLLRLDDVAGKQGNQIEDVGEPLQADDDDLGLVDAERRAPARLGEQRLHPWQVAEAFRDAVAHEHLADGVETFRQPLGGVDERVQVHDPRVVGEAVQAGLHRAEEVDEVPEDQPPLGQAVADLDLEALDVEGKIVAHPAGPVTSPRGLRSTPPGR